MITYNIILENAGNLKFQGKEDNYVLCGIVTFNFNGVLAKVREVNKILRKKYNIPSNGQISAKKINIEDEKLLFTTVESVENTYIVALIIEKDKLHLNKNNEKEYYYYLVEKYIEYLIDKNLIEPSIQNTIHIKLNENSILKEDRNTMLYYLKTQINLEKDLDVNIYTSFCNLEHEVLLQTANTFASSIYIPASTTSRSEVYSKFNKNGKLKIYNFKQNL